MTTLDTTLSARDIFDNLQPEQEQEFRRAQVKENPALEAMTRGFEEAGMVYKKGVAARFVNRFVNQRATYQSFLGNVPEGYSARDVELFSLWLQPSDEKNSNYKAALYLSALINNCPEDEVVVHTVHLPDLVYLAFGNDGKQVTIKGNSGYWTGQDMESGRIIIEGNATRGLGEGMADGEMIVNGNGGYETGRLMEGGLIVVNGNCEYHVGGAMKGGKIHVHGDCDGVGNNMESGEVVIDGNAGIGSYSLNKVGYAMKGGLIHIKGNVDGTMGRNMSGGVIHVDGNIRYAVGPSMSGGEIHAPNSKYFLISKQIKGGNVFRKGKQIVKDGKKIK